MSHHIVSKPLVSEPLCVDMPVKHCALVSAIATRFTYLLALSAKTVILCVRFFNGNFYACLLN